MYEKHRESNALAAISRALKSDDGLNKKDQRVSKEDERYIDAPAVNEKQEKEKNIASAPLSTSSSSDNRDSSDSEDKDTSSSKSTDEVTSNDGDVDMQNVDAIDSRKTHEEEINPPQPTRFDEWYYLQMAESFENEIDAIQNADTPINAKILMQAFSSNIPLYTELERRVALENE